MGLVTRHDGLEREWCVVCTLANSDFRVAVIIARYTLLRAPRERAVDGTSGTVRYFDSQRPRCGCCTATFGQRVDEETAAVVRGLDFDGVILVSRKTVREQASSWPGRLVAWNGQQWNTTGTLDNG